MYKNESVSIVIVSAYPPDVGRLSEYCKELVESLSKILGKPLLILSDTCEASNTQIIVRNCWKPDNIFSILKLWLNIFRVKCRLIHFNIHLAVFGSSRLVNFLGILSIFLAKMSGKKVVTTLHNIPDAIKIDNVGLKNSLLNRIGFSIAMKILVHSSTFIVVKVREYVKILGQRYSAKNVKFIPHGAWFTDRTCSWKHDSPPNILFIGYLAPYKDLKRVIEIIENLRRIIPGLKLIISGLIHPNYSNKKSLPILRDILSNPNVKYLGRVPDQDIPKLVSISRVLILPYKTSTGTSGVYHLVAALGIPVIAPPTLEFMELVKEGAGIALINLWSNNAENKVLKLLNDEKTLLNLSKKNISYALKRKWDDIAKEYVKLYREALKS